MTSVAGRGFLQTIASFFGIGPKALTTERSEVLRRDAAKYAELARNAEIAQARWEKILAMPAHEYIAGLLQGADINVAAEKIVGANYSFWIVNENLGYGTPHLGKITAVNVTGRTITLYITDASHRKFYLEYIEEVGWQYGGYSDKSPVKQLCIFE